MPVAEDLARAGGLQRREVEREEPPDAVGEEAVDRAAPDLAVGGRLERSRPLGRRWGASRSLHGPGVASAQQGR